MTMADPFAGKSDKEIVAAAREPYTINWQPLNGAIDEFRRLEKIIASLRGQVSQHEREKGELLARNSRLNESNRILEGKADLLESANKSQYETFEVQRARINTLEREAHEAQSRYDTVMRANNDLITERESWKRDIRDLQAKRDLGLMDAELNRLRDEVNRLKGDKAYEISRNEELVLENTRLKNGDYVAGLRGQLREAQAGWQKDVEELRRTQERVRQLETRAKHIKEML